MNETQQEIWKERIEASFRISNEVEFRSALDRQLSELWEIGPIVVRPMVSSNCSDGCCELDQWVMEEYTSRYYAHLAMLFGDNAIQPVWRVVLDVQI